MAVFHFSATIVKRSHGQTSITVASRRSGTSLFDRRIGLTQRPISRDMPVHSEIMLPSGAPDKWRDRETLWNDIEAFEARKDSQVAREIEISLPIELSTEAAIALARSYASEIFLVEGMVVDLNVRIRQGLNSNPNPWASLLLTTRPILNGGFGLKVRDWNDRRRLITWRSAWAAHANAALRCGGFVADLDHRSHAERGIRLEPQNKIGPAAARRSIAGEVMERVEEHKAIAARNGRRSRRTQQAPSVGLEPAATPRTAPG